MLAKTLNKHEYFMMGFMYFMSQFNLFICMSVFLSIFYQQTLTRFSFNYCIKPEKTLNWKNKCKNLFSCF